jgi:HAD superfamily hydrolase (TIGR01459 family)
MNHFETVCPLIDRYSAYILDAYGVFWGGNEVAVFPHAEELMRTLVQQGKIVVILSNSTQLASLEVKKFHTHGLIQEEHFHCVITSGELARAQLLNNTLPSPTQKKCFYVLGGAHPHFPNALALFHDTGYTMTESLDDADFIYLSVPHINGEDVVDPELFTEQVRSVLPRKLPLLCANPDRFAHEGKPPRAVVRQGSLAALYEQLGGEVYYIGKPYPNAYTETLNRLSQYTITSPSHILMIGDTPETDILGGNRAGVHTALITATGMFMERCLINKNALHTLKSDETPTYFVHRFCL